MTRPMYEFTGSESLGLRTLHLPGKHSQQRHGGKGGGGGGGGGAGPPVTDNEARRAGRPKASADGQTINVDKNLNTSVKRTSATSATLTDDEGIESVTIEKASGGEWAVTGSKVASLPARPVDADNQSLGVDQLSGRLNGNTGVRVDKFPPTRQPDRVDPLEKVPLGRRDGQGRPLLSPSWSVAVNDALDRQES